MKAYPKESFTEELKVTDVALWAQESYNLAVSNAYAGIYEGGEPSQKYLKENQEVARKRICLAGYRLAMLFEKSLESQAEADDK